MRRVENGMFVMVDMKTPGGVHPRVGNHLLDMAPASIGVFRLYGTATPCTEKDRGENREDTEQFHRGSLHQPQGGDFPCGNLDESANIPVFLSVHSDVEKGGLERAKRGRTLTPPNSKTIPT